ncbi:BppU family phage baseplate upper protein [Listeria aquatica]|uniref:BppU family phage baseplate upper protein n=1 Tax=Listeria aquatica TaxID=1494960 RepID=A0A841ZM75_9LIST|nr:BppU family phage baseplate upper protein [Listeria aquatica]MBC1521396.1 BppU family phage baseplate upper protein [Listeria aquatica]
MNELNSVYKKVQSELDVGVYGVQPINLKATFSTQDENTALLRFVVKKEGTLLPLSEPAKAVIYLVGNQLKIQKDMEVDRENSIVSYLLTAEEVKHYGKVDGEVYIHYNNEGKQSLSVHKFTFNIDRALIDQDLDTIENVYISDLEDIKSEYLDQFENLKTELEEKVTQLQTDTAELQKEAQELEQKFDAIDPDQFAKKTGDTFTGPVNLDAQEALNVRYGYLFHYVGAKPNGTVITIDFAEEFGVWSNRLEITVGGEGVQSENGEFGLEPITSINPYVKGWAPASYTSSKSTINGIEKSAKGTITPKNAISVARRDGSIGKVMVNGSKVYTESDPIQSYQLTDSAGKLMLKTNVDFNNLDASFDTSFMGYLTTSINIPFGLNPNGYFTLRMRTSGYGVATFQPYNSNVVIVNRREGNANGWKGWEMPQVDTAQIQSALDASLTVQKVTLTPKNGFTASRTLTASYVKMGNRYWVSVSGIVAKGTGNGTGICATVPTMLAPDTDWNKLFSGAQQSTAASNHANIYLSSGGDINIVAVGAADVNTGLDGISYFTKEVTA